VSFGRKLKSPAKRRLLVGRGLLEKRKCHRLLEKVKTRWSWSAGGWGRHFSFNLISEIAPSWWKVIDRLLKKERG